MEIYVILYKIRLPLNDWHGVIRLEPRTDTLWIAYIRDKMKKRSINWEILEGYWKINTKTYI